MHHTNLAALVLVVIPVLPAFLDLTDIAGLVGDAQATFEGLADVAATALKCPLDKQSRRVFARLIQNGRTEARSRAPVTSDLYFKRHEADFAQTRERWVQEHPPCLPQQGVTTSDPASEIAGQGAQEEPGQAPMSAGR